MRRYIVLAVALLALGGTTLFFGTASRNIAAQANTSGAVVEASPGTSVADGLVERASASWPWYVTRVSGLVAAVSLVILMLSGVGLLTGHTFSFFEPLTAWASHRALGIVFGLAVLLHVFGLYVDHFVPFGIWDITIPFLSDYKPITLFGVSVGSLYVALGVLSLYMTCLVVITSLVWVEKRPYLWKLVHLLSYLIMLFVFVHALYLGTDLSSGWLRLVWIGLGLVLVYVVLARLWRAKTI